MAIEKRIVGDEEIYTVGDQEVPVEFRATLRNSMDVVSQGMNPHVVGIQRMVAQQIPGLTEVVVLLCAPDGRVASVVGTLPSRLQMEALRNALVLTEKVAKATDN